MTAGHSRTPPIARFAVKRRRARARYELGLEINGQVVVWSFELAAPSTASDERVLSRSGRRDLDWLSSEGAEVDDGGPAIVWDRGGWSCEDDAVEGLARGKLRFDLSGFKLIGRFALGRNKGTWLGRGRGWRASNDWTLVMVPGEHPVPPRPSTSVLSGGSIDDPKNQAAGAALCKALADAKAPRRSITRGPETAMGSATEREPFSDDGWLFELRRGGVEVLAGRYRNRGELRDVSGAIETAALRDKFPELIDHLGALPVGRLLVHAEIAIDGRDQLPDSAELDHRLGLEDPAEIEAAALARPATLRVFDLLGAEGFDARELELATRKSLLESLLPEAGPIRFADHIATEGEALAERIAGVGGFSIAARRADSTYRSGQSDDWVTLEARDPPTDERDDDGDRDRPRQRLTNRKKLFWPDDGLTKGDLLDYYRDIAPVLLPHLEDRPVVLARYPDGIYGRWFFQHHAPGAKSSFLRTVRISTSRRPRDYFLIDDVAALLYLINMGTIPLHAWPCRVGSLEKPDWATIDVNRSSATLADVIDMTLAVRELCEEVELPTFVKTSGGTGMHVQIPLAGQLDWDQARMLAEALARTVEARFPDRSTTQPSIADRGDRVYLDFMVNARGRLLIAPYSARAKRGATISTPLSWDEVDGSLDPSAFTILSGPERMADRPDPHADFLDVEADIVRAIALLSASTGTKK